MIVALERAVFERDTRWTNVHELLATGIEFVSAFMRQHAMANGAKNVGKPLSIPRPGAQERKPPALGFRAFAQQLAAARG